MWVASCWELSDEAQHRLVYWLITEHYMVYFYYSIKCRPTKYFGKGHFKVRVKFTAKMCVQHECLWVLTDGRSSRFPLWRYQLQASVVRGAMGRGWCQRQRRSGECHRVQARMVTQSGWHRSWIEGSFSGLKYPSCIRRPYRLLTLPASSSECSCIVSMCPSICLSPRSTAAVTSSWFAAAQ